MKETSNDKMDMVVVQFHTSLKVCCMNCPVLKTVEDPGLGIEGPWLKGL